MNAVEEIPVIVLNWNGIEDTEKCIEHLLEQTYPGLKIHLADNGSEPDDVRRLKELSEKYTSIELTLFNSNLGFAKAHNILIERILADSNCPEYILLLNNDAFAEPGWAEALIHTARNSEAELVSSKMINFFDRTEIDNVGHRFLNTAEIIPKGTGDAPDSFSSSEINAGPCAGAALYSTEMLRTVGSFDPYFDTGYEDAELGVRAMVMGYQTRFAPDAIVYHKISRSVSKIRDFDYVLKMQLNIFYTYFKLMPTMVILVNLCFLLFKYITVLILNLVFGKWFFFRVMRTAIWKCLTTERSTIQQARTEFKNVAGKRVSSWQIIRNMEFFLWFDIHRFFKHMIRGEKTQFEKVTQSSSRE